MIPPETSTNQKALSSLQFSSQQQHVELAVIINSFDRLSLLRNALPSIVQALKQTPLEAAIIVFDAGSTDGSIEFIDEFAKGSQDIPILCLCPSSDTDRSFSGGCNFATQFAAQTYPDLKYCFLFETDNFIKNESALPLAIQLLEQEEQLAAIGFTVELHNGEKAGFGCRFPTPLAFLVGQQVSALLGLEELHIQDWHSFSEARWGLSETVYTSPLLVRYSVWQALGGMDVETFPFCESDNDWCWRAYKQGWRTAILDVPGVIHDNKTQSSAWSENRVMDYHRARLRILMKHKGRWVAVLKPLLFARHFLEFVLLGLKGLYSSQGQASFKKRLVLMKSVFNGYELPKVT